ncbi:MAG: hypothetical protein P4L58_02060, partial [Candidatus Pacebacteria bacterium]|nr:hypothetical protein [Candidatus Paceibacterota bacterium]
LNAVKNVGHTVAHEIVEERKRGGKFQTLTGFIERVRHKDLNKKSLEALAKVGAFDAFAERNALLASIDNILSHSKNFEKLQNSSQISLFGENDMKLPEITLSASIEASSKERLAWEKELLGLYISDHPANAYRDYFEQMALPIKNITPDMNGQTVTIGGVITKIKKIYLKSQKTMLFAAIEDPSGAMEILVFPKLLEMSGSIWEEEKVIIATGRLSDKDGEMKLLADSAKLVTDEELANFKRILETQKKNGTYKQPAPDIPPPQGEDVRYSGQERAAENPSTKLLITFPHGASKEILQSLSQFFDACQPGDLKIYLALGGKKIETPYRVSRADGLGEKIKAIAPNSQIRIF